jgi:hypothetical protein
MERADPTPRLWWAVPAGAFLLLMALAMVFGGPPEAKPGRSSYDAGSGGLRAAYLLLEELRYPVTRSRRPTGEAVRWALFPVEKKADPRLLGGWVRDGGVLLFADGSADFAKGLGLEVRVEHIAESPDVVRSNVPGVAAVAPGPTRVAGPAGGRVWAEAGGQPLVTVYPLGRGAVWLVHRPDFLTNRLLREADNGVLLCRLAEAMLAHRPGRLAFDEYVHGLRDRPTVVALLFRPPAVWVTVQGLLLLALLLGHYAPRFGPLRPPPPPSRRSKEEFLDALAALLERKADAADAWRTACADFRHALAHELGLPPDVPTGVLVAETARRRPVGGAVLERLLRPDRVPAGSAAGVLLGALNELETLRDETFHGRRPR